MSGRLAAFDVETTAADAEEARIVTAAVAVCGGGAANETTTWLADPGVEIPEAATAVHGITTEQARAAGELAGDVVAQIVDALAACAANGWPLAIFNAPYDLTVLDREARRYGIVPLADRGPFHVIDPLVLDKWLDRYRSGPRTLTAVAEHYRAGLDDAHTADADALSTARLAYVMCLKARVVRKTRDPAEAQELLDLRALWDLVRDDLPALHHHQADLAREQAEGLRQHFLDKGKTAAADEVSGDWPWVPVATANARARLRRLAQDATLRHSGARWRAHEAVYPGSGAAEMAETYAAADRVAHFKAQRLLEDLLANLPDDQDAIDYVRWLCDELAPTPDLEAAP